jgi:hypothetical protein
MHHHGRVHRSLIHSTRTRHGAFFLFCNNANNTDRKKTAEMHTVSRANVSRQNCVDASCCYFVLAFIRVFLSLSLFQFLRDTPAGIFFFFNCEVAGTCLYGEGLRVVVYAHLLPRLFALCPSSVFLTKKRVFCVLLCGGLAALL